MDILVQKYGGTSMADDDCIEKVAQKVIQAKSSGKKVVVVVSAPAGLTDQLIEKAKKISESPNPREMDIILSTGEQISVALLTMKLQTLGIKATALTSAQVGIFTDSNYTEAKIKKINPQRIKKELLIHDVVILPGFQGVSGNRELTTLGRGGSDTTAVAIAVALRCPAVEIFTDVLGVYTADPRIVAASKKIERLSYEEMLELSGSGAKVLHFRSVELAAKHKCEIHLRSTFSEEPGTIVTSEVEEMEKILVRGVTYSLDYAQLTMKNLPLESNVIVKLFKAIAEKNIIVDVICQTGVCETSQNLSFTLDKKDYLKALEVVKNFISDIQGVEFFARTDLARVSVVGNGMKSHYGVAYKVFACLDQLEIETEMITTSTINISCMIPHQRVKEATAAIHHAFELDKI